MKERNRELPYDFLVKDDLNQMLSLASVNDSEPDSLEKNFKLI